MKVFVSWSGTLSCEIAEVLKKWIPCIIQSIEVFYSKEDIAKGDNWDKTISSELSECKYGIICLTHDNTMAPWINFEAGAIAKSLDSKVTALMINIKPSDIQGPLSRYQATKFEKNEFLQLITSINSVLEIPLHSNVLQNAFEAMWPSIEEEAKKILDAHSTKQESKKLKLNKIEQNENDPLEEILQLLRKQSALLSNPENLFPIEYVEFIQRKSSRYIDKSGLAITDSDIILDELFNAVRLSLNRLESLPRSMRSAIVLEAFNFEGLFGIISQYIKKNNNKNLFMKFKDLKMQYSALLSATDKYSDIDIIRNLEG